MKDLLSHTRVPAWLAPLLVAALVLLLRLPLATDQPYTDEGIYAAAGYFQYRVYTGALPEAGWLLPREGHLSLYPLLTSWVYELRAQPLLLLRLLDAVVAVVAMLAMLRVFERLGSSRLAALIAALFLTLALNHALFINAGFKNALMPALLAMALALLQLLDRKHLRPALAGVWMALAVLLREFFLPFALVLALLAWQRGGFVAFVRFAVAGLASGLLVLALLVSARGPGGLQGLIAAYTGFAGNIEALAERLAATAGHGRSTALLLWPLLPLALVALALPLWARSPQSARQALPTSNYVLACAMAACPLLEIAYKSGFPYHFSTIAIGLAMLVAVALPRLAGWAVAALVALGVVGLLPLYAREQAWSAAAALRFAPVMLKQDWQSPVAAKSLYLRAAAAVREHTAPDARLMVETASAVLFPLTGRLPAATGMGDVSRVATRRNLALRGTEVALLKDHPPDVLVLVPRGPGDLNVPPLARELAATFPKQLVMPPGLSPYGAWSTELYWRPR